MADDQAPATGRRAWIGLAVLALPTMLLSLDISVLFLALPHLSTDLGADSTQQLWITDIYGFMTAGFLVTMGTLGDRIGRRKLLLIGATAFSLVSLVAAFSVSAEMLIIARALLGIVGATLLPSTLALITNMFHNPRQLGSAIAIWATSFMVGVALGPVIGGALLESFWWGSVFLVSLPVMGLLLVTAPFLLPEYRDPAGGRLDLPSVALSLATILPIVYGLKELTRSGWGVPSVAALLAGVLMGVAFVTRQSRLAHPLLDVRLFRHRSFSGALTVGMLVGALQTGTGLLVAIYLQSVAGLSPLQAGLWLVLPALALVVSINVTPRLARRIRPAHILAGGMAIAMLGQLMIAQIDGSAGPIALLIGVSVVYFGVGPVGGLINQVALGCAPPEKAGSAASMVSTGGEFGVALGVAVFGTIGAAVYRGQLTLPAGVPADVAQAGVDGGVSGAVAAAARLPEALGTELVRLAREAFTSGLNVVAAVSVVAFCALGVLALTLLRQVGPLTGHGDHGGHPEPVVRHEELAVSSDR
ncbi:MFS transporter [Sphaerimonospora thailandensis]|uniref:MFS transporter n=1 Tax=Sphaerimonospora thailandensis TaxID=795644 RepID=A0A8J3R3P6_9ACTN|nr:MFS transporter [Sphaerimonospora thailandensis]GIH67810.1 MFS transporter [Sphaerimonospora thailandensis]